MADFKKLYESIRDCVVNAGYQGEVDWCEHRPMPENIDAETFLSEYAWVVLHSGMRTAVADKIFERYKAEGTSIIGHAGKRAAIEFITSIINDVLWSFKHATDKLEYLDSLPWIGPVTRYHLARNLGVDIAKPDRHLVRIATLLGFNGDVQAFCAAIQPFTTDRLGTIDLIFWRFAVLFPDYEVLLPVFARDAPKPTEKWDPSPHRWFRADPDSHYLEDD
jgi:hypothetical protein